MYLIIGALLTAVCVSISGVIGFVGLVIPHVIRMGFSAKHKYLIPLSALLGGFALGIVVLGIFSKEDLRLFTGLLLGRSHEGEMSLL